VLLSICLLYAFANDACNNPSDLSKVGDRAKTTATTAQCGKQCALNPSIGTCVSSCVESATGVSSACGACFGADAECTKKHCALKCIDPTSSRCIACSTQYCGASMKDCSGLPADEPDVIIPLDPSTCAGGDLSRISNYQDLVQAQSSCGNTCKGNGNLGNCMTSCVANALGIGQMCARCFGDEAVCTSTQCYSQCSNGIDQNCVLCSMQKCGHQMSFCLGLPTSFAVHKHRAPAVADDDGSGACNNTGDISKVKNRDTTKETQEQCGKQCMLDGDIGTCVGQCMTNQLGISDGCAACFGQEAACTKQHCALRCLNPSSDRCVQCSMQYCAADLATCGGIPVNN